MKDIAEKTEQELVESLDLFDLELSDKITEGWEERFAQYDKEHEAARKRLEPVYGSRWVFEWAKEQGLFVTETDRMKDVNTFIYQTACHFRQGLGSVYFNEKLRMREYELFGKDYDRLFFHKPHDPEIAELLLQDAVKTGKWQELPDCLQDEYKRRTFGRRRKK